MSAPVAAPPALRLVRRHPLSAYVVLACLFGWAIWIAALVGDSVEGGNLPVGPIVAAFVVVACQGRDELRTWGRRLVDWRAGWRWYLLAVLAPIVLHVVIVLVNHLLGAPLPTSDQLSDWPQVPVTFMVLLVLIGIGEEAGWTAFAAPILLRRHSLLVAWALASAMRIMWHLPLMLSGDLPWAVGILANAAFTLVTLVVLVASGGHWSLAAVWHAMLNAAGAGFLFAMVSGTDRDHLDLMLVGIYVLVALVAYALWRRRPGPDPRLLDEGSGHVERHAAAHL